MCILFVLLFCIVNSINLKSINNSNSYILILIVFIVCVIGCMIGMIIDRFILLKFFLCYEILFFTISVIMLMYSVDINVMILVFYLLSNSTFEVILGLSVLLIGVSGW